MTGFSAEVGIPNRKEVRKAGMPNRKEIRKFTHNKPHHNCFAKKYATNRKLAVAFDRANLDVNIYFKHIGFVVPKSMRNPSFKLVLKFKNWMKRFCKNKSKKESK